MKGVMSEEMKRGRSERGRKVKRERRKRRKTAAGKK